ncbi:MAG: HAD family hydrolase [Sphingomicrobium sp.]
MSRPLLITDCDEVLLHMVAHFQEWLDEAHDVYFAFETGQFAEALTHRPSGAIIPDARVWELLWQFFREEMDRQTPVPGAIEALRRIGDVADIVVLTNLGHDAQPLRVAQLASHGLHYEVVCNQGGKGVPARAIIDRHQPSVTVFVDDLHMHHQSVAKHAPEVWRLHMVAEPRLAPNVGTPEAAHARIDDWPTATDWILDRFRDGPAGGSK